MNYLYKEMNSANNLNIGPSNGNYTNIFVNKQFKSY